MLHVKANRYSLPVAIAVVGCAMLAHPYSLAFAGEAELPALATSALPDNAALELEVPFGMPFAWEKGNDDRRTTILSFYRIAGKWQPDVWAFAARLAAAEHRGRLVEASSDGDVLNFVVEIDVRHQLPRYFGGKVRYDITLERNGRYVNGRTKIEARGLDRDGIEAMALKIGKRLDKKDHWPGRLTIGELTGDARGELRTYDRFLEAQVQQADTKPQSSALLNPQLDQPALKQWRPAAEAITRIKGSTNDQRDTAQTPSKEHPAMRAAAQAWLGAALDDAGLLDAAKNNTEAALSSKPDDANDYARAVAGVAIAYAASGKRWPDELQNKVEAWLRLRISESVLLVYPDREHDAYSTAWWNAMAQHPDGPYDYWLASHRAAAGLALLTLNDPKLAEAQRIVERSIYRFIRTGIGKRGWGTGQVGYCEAVSLVGPYVQALKQARGIDLAEDTGLEWVAMAGLVSDGQVFARDDASSLAWLIPAMGLAKRSHVPIALRMIEDSDRTTPSIWGDLLLLATSPRDAKTWAAAKAMDNSAMQRALPLAWQDDQMGGYAWRSGWKPESFVTRVELASGPREAAHRVGHFTFSGLGHDWIITPRESLPLYRWPPRPMHNAIHVYNAPVTHHSDAEPTMGGRMHDAFALPDGSGTVSMIFGKFRERDVKSDADRERDSVLFDSSRAWRTIGVDYSGKSGAEALLVCIDTTYQTDPRERAWEIHVGDVPAKNVTIAYDRFMIKPADGKATLTGTFVFPSTVHIAYEPPKKSKDGTMRSGRIVAWNAEPTKRAKSIFEQRLNREPDSEDLDIGLPDILETAEEQKERLDNEKRRKQWHKLVYDKIAAATTTVKMGAPDKHPRARNSLVVVLTVQTGKAPTIQPLGDKTQAMLLVGKQPVTFRPYALHFGDIE